MNEVSTRTTLVGPSAGVARAWMAVGLLFLFMLINFADKAVLGLAAVHKQRDRSRRSRARSSHFRSVT